MRKKLWLRCQLPLVTGSLCDFPDFPIILLSPPPWQTKLWRAQWIRRQLALHTLCGMKLEARQLGVLCAHWERDVNCSCWYGYRFLWEWRAQSMGRNEVRRAAEAACVRCADEEGMKWHNSQGENESVKRTERLWAQWLGLEEGNMTDVPFKKTLLKASVKIHCRILIVKIDLYVWAIKHWKVEEQLRHNTRNLWTTL